MASHLLTLPMPRLLNYLWRDATLFVVALTLLPDIIVVVLIRIVGTHAIHGVQLAVHCVLGFAEIEVRGAEGGEERNKSCN